MIRRAMDLAIVGVAAVMISDGGVCKDIKIVLGAVAPTPIRASKAEQVLKGKAPADSLIKEAAKKAAGEARPISDIRSSLEYRKEMVEVLTRKAVKQAWEKAIKA
jgi:carbon-monoxide dehydrogenase medium subunit